jgi:hypothetical protein
MAHYKRVWLRYQCDQQISNSSGLTVVNVNPIECKESKEADAEIQKLITLGWRIVSTSPVTSSVNFLNPKGDDMYATYTSGIEVFLIKE